MATTILSSYFSIFLYYYRVYIWSIHNDFVLHNSCPDKLWLLWSDSFAFSLYDISISTQNLFVCMCWINCSLEKQKNRTLNTLGNLTFSGTLNGQLLDASRISGTTEDLFTSKLKAELDRSINKHLEAGTFSKS